MKATTEQLNKIFEDVSQTSGAERATAVKGAMFRFLNTTPAFYSSPDNIWKLCDGIAYTGGDFTEVQAYRDMFERLKANNAALESEPAPVSEVAPKLIDDDGFTEADRQRAKARLAVKQERELWNMPADQYREKIDDPALRRKHVR